MPTEVLIKKKRESCLIFAPLVPASYSVIHMPGDGENNDWKRVGWYTCPARKNALETWLLRLGRWNSKHTLQRLETDCRPWILPKVVHSNLTVNRDGRAQLSILINRDRHKWVYSSSSIIKRSKNLDAHHLPVRESNPVLIRPTDQKSQSKSALNYCTSGKC